MKSTFYAKFNFIYLNRTICFIKTIVKHFEYTLHNSHKMFKHLFCLESIWSWKQEFSTIVVLFNASTCTKNVARIFKHMNYGFLKSASTIAEKRLMKIYLKLYFLFIRDGAIKWNWSLSNDEENINKNHTNVVKYRNWIYRTIFGRVKIYTWRNYFNCVFYWDFLAISQVILPSVTHINVLLKWSAWMIVKNNVKNIVRIMIKRLVRFLSLRNMSDF